MSCHTKAVVRKIAVTLEYKTLNDLDRWVREGRYSNRSRALQSVIDILAEPDKRSRLARELKKLDRVEEQRLAEEGIGDSAWPRS
jgi:Arc/MetJ-type ribon-helix-helix transcriptional regulator